MSRQNSLGAMLTAVRCLYSSMNELTLQKAHASDGSLPASQRLLTHQLIPFFCKITRLNNAIMAFGKLYTREVII